MKRALKKAVAFALAAAAAMSVTVTSFAASAGKQIVKNSYSTFISSQYGVFLTDITHDSKADTVVIVSDSGKKTKVKVKNADKVQAIYGGIDITNGSYNCMVLDCGDSSKMIFSNGKIVSTKGKLSSASGKTVVYKDSTYRVYNEKGKVIANISTPTLKDSSDCTSIKLANYSANKKASLFYGYKTNAYGYEMAAKWWLVKSGKTLQSGELNWDYWSSSASFVKNTKGADVLKYNDGQELHYFSAATGKEIKNFEAYESTESDKYSWNYDYSGSSSKAIITDSNGDKVYSIKTSKIAFNEIHSYKDCVLIVTRSSDNKYGCLCVS